MLSAPGLKTRENLFKTMRSSKTTIKRERLENLRRTNLQDNYSLFVVVVVVEVVVVAVAAAYI